MLKYKLIFILLVFGLLSCQPINILDKKVYDYDNLPKLLMYGQEKKINNLYDSNFTEPYIDHSLDNPPINYLNLWFDNNINLMGNNNLLQINILDASLKRSEIKNLDAKHYDDKMIFLFEINFLVEFVLYDDVNTVLASSIVETKRTVTSSKYISILESEIIINNLISDAMMDFSLKSNELIKIHMKNYII